MPTGIDYELRKLHYDVALQANRPALAAVLPSSQHRRFYSAATIRSARRPTAFVASRNMGYHGNAERLLPRLRSKAHERI
jgi:hypothetical protein